MKLKEKGHSVSIVKKFDLLGNDEEALSKALSYTISHERKTLFTLLQYLGVKKKNTTSNFKEISIETERHRKEGRTDIEIKFQNHFHVIIESKIGGNKVTKQRTQYLNSFDKDCPQKILCFITQLRNTNKEIKDNIDIVNISWYEITEILNNKELTKSTLVREFLDFTTKNYRMNELKEILIQDLGDKTEIKRFKVFSVYRRGITFGSPLYFAPYFTRKAKQEEGEGIAYLSKVLGVLTLKPKDVDNFKIDLLRFSDKNKELIEKWIKGVLLTDKKTNEIFTFYFLAEPLRLDNNLLKDGTRNKGRGKNWIAAMIPKNRSVTFEEFTRRLNMANKKSR